MTKMMPERDPPAHALWKAILYLCLPLTQILSRWSFAQVLKWSQRLHDTRGRYAQAARPTTSRCPFASVRPDFDTLEEMIGDFLELYHLLTAPDSEDQDIGNIAQTSWLHYVIVVLFLNIFASMFRISITNFVSTIVSLASVRFR